MANLNQHTSGLRGRCVEGRVAPEAGLEPNHQKSRERESLELIEIKLPKLDGSVEQEDGMALAKKFGN